MTIQGKALFKFCLSTNENTELQIRLPVLFHLDGFPSYFSVNVFFEALNLQILSYCMIKEVQLYGFLKAMAPLYCVFGDTLEVLQKELLQTLQLLLQSW